ncbi:hypothetical protein [Legionella londiniensis]|uniref:Transposase n=1 Tax=Legionella londiniensis TaxID=45068 RepID=A0A0W0VMI0_9GAMM|nr:hypothetical protein [Legionella londiniensis]KTD21101.1 hypothetical protein Llon_1199 [Legionella londiniensis]STX93109.1 Uncharacterised protein [Legionella londiniensis]STX93123.1 Uncharacterised protein [Legionella londiniensis]
MEDILETYKQAYDPAYPVICRDEVANEVKAWVERRNKNAYVVNWQFTAENDRIKLKRLYPTIKDKINLME